MPARGPGAGARGVGAAATGGSRGSGAGQTGVGPRRRNLHGTSSGGPCTLVGSGTNLSLRSGARRTRGARGRRQAAAAACTGPIRVHSSGGTSPRHLQRCCVVVGPPGPEWSGRPRPTFPITDTLSLLYRSERYAGHMITWRPARGPRGGPVDRDPRRPTLPPARGQCRGHLERKGEELESKGDEEAHGIADIGSVQPHVTVVEDAVKHEPCSLGIGVAGAVTEGRHAGHRVEHHPGRRRGVARTARERPVPSCEPYRLPRCS
jgi:hypothetical protein